MVSLDFSVFWEKFGKVKNIVVLIGVGVSVESGVLIFWGVGGLWRIFVV